MGVYKEGKNWKVQVYYKDWQGNQKKSILLYQAHLLHRWNIFMKSSKLIDIMKKKKG